MNKIILKSEHQMKKLSLKILQHAVGYIALAAVFFGVADGYAQTPETPNNITIKKASPDADVVGNVLKPGQIVMFQDNFRSPKDALHGWSIAEDARYRLPKPDPERIAIVDAPYLAEGAKAVRFFVPRAPNSFRAEIGLQTEHGWNERWYGERILIPKDWVIDPSKARTIMLQWHGVPGNFRPTFPNLDLSVQGNHWKITRSFGDPKTKPTRDYAMIDKIKPGTWVSWVTHAKWSPNEDGFIKIWKDGKLVFDRKGPNVYGTIGVEYTPHLQTGIYHPFWHVTGDESRKDDVSRAAFDAETASHTQIKNKTIYVTDFKMGNEHATYKDVSPGGELPQ